jgi:protein involved in polysaccharide export with SLBB domain
MARALAALLAISACTTTGPAPPNREEIAAIEEKAERLNAGDIVEIKVFREPDLAGVYRVGRDGTIDFPLIGKVTIREKHPDTVAREIGTRLADGYLRNPQVSVFVRESKSQKIHVLGEVEKAGSFAYEPGMTVIQAITAAGGFGQLAATNSVKVTRLDVEQPFSVPVGDIRKGEAPNFLLQPGDIVYVPEAIF